jgi:hypothetical protein
VLAYTIAAEIGDINRFPTPRKLAGYSGLCPASTNRRPRPARPAQPSKVRAICAGRSSRPPPTPAPPRPTATATSRRKTRIGKQRGAKVAQIDLARRLAEAIWHMLTREQPFAPKGATDPLAA